jgi:hypothetical protein
MAATTKTSKTKAPKITISKTGLRAFLEENKRKMFEIGDDENCPIAKYINSQLPKGLFSAVGDEEIDIRSKLKVDLEDDEPGTLKTMKTPAWAKNFIGSFDGMEGKDSGDKITGAAILAAELI